MQQSRIGSWWKAPLIVASLLLGAACGSGSGGGNPPAPLPTDIGDALRATPGVVSVQEPASTISGTRFFLCTFQQPVDHTLPGGTSFQQTFTLLYRSRTAPVVLATTGYGISRNPGQGEPTALLQANQITLEHRYFTPSAPSPMDWPRLTILQAANDQHRLVAALKPHFTGKWISSGGSKGGMTALYHRRFFPADVDATLAYVAPNSLGNPDPRYIPFVDSRGSSGCRAALDAWQQAILNRRIEVRALLEADAARLGRTLSILGSDMTLEFAVIEAPFIFWQYSNASLCDQIPAATATPAALYAFLDRVYFGVVSSWDDAALTYYAPYYYQSAVQLGYPAVKDAHLTGLLYRGMDLPDIYPPLGVPKPYDAAAMADIQEWVSGSATRVMFVYGENDSWSGGAFLLPPEAQGRDNFLYVVPAGNHGARLSQLPAAQNAEATSVLARWMGVQPQSQPASKSTESVFDGEATFIQRKPVRNGPRIRKEGIATKNAKSTKYPL